MRRTKTKTAAKKTPRAPLLMALEPRVMFDGAAAPSAHALHADHHVPVATLHAAAEFHVIATPPAATDSVAQRGETIARVYIGSPGRITEAAVAADRVAADRVAADRVAADRVAADRVAADRGAAPARNAGGLRTVEVHADAPALLSKSLQSHTNGTNSTTQVGSAAQLNAAIAADDLDLLGNDTITLTGNITYASAADAASITHVGTGTLTIDGAGHTIDAAYLARVLTVNSGNVVLENVTIEHGLLAGAGGTLSAPGVSELGAGIYNAGTLTLNNVLVTQNVATGGGGGGTGVVGAGGGGGSGAGGIGGAVGGGLGTNGSGSTGGKGSGTGGGLGGSATGGGMGGTPSAGGSPGGSGATASSGGVTAGGGGGGAGYVAGNGAAGGAAAGGIYNAGTGKLYVIGTSAITNNIGAGGGGGGGIGASLVNLVNVPFHGGVGGQGVGGIFDASTGQVFITTAAYSASTGNVGSSGTIGSAIGGGSNAGVSTPAGAALINSGSGTFTAHYVPPAVTSINVVGSSPNNAGSEQFTVNFSEAVTGVNVADFALANTGTASGIITSVTGSGSTYTVLVNPALGDGTMGLVFNAVTPVLDASGTAAVGSFTAGQVYTIDHTPPVATSITTVGVSPNSASSEQFTVNFSENVTGVTVADFNLVNTGTVNGTVASVTAVNGQTYTVTVNGVTGNGTMQLNLNATGTGIVDAAGNAIVGGALLDQAYTITHTLPVVTSINTVGPNPNDAGSEQFTVNFSESVTGVNVADFALANTGTAGGVITSVTGSGSVYTVLVNPAFGDGTMKLNFNPLTPVVDAGGNLAASSFTSGQSYTIEHTPPVATSFTATAGDSGSAASEQFTLNFSESVTGVDAGDFTLAKTGNVTGSIAAVTGSGSSYTVTVTGVTGDGTLQANLNASGTGITDAAGNALLGGALGQVYVIEHTPPVALSITSTAANPNNSGSDQFTVNFSEAVGGVDATDFSLLKTGTVAGAVTAVTAINPDANGRATAYAVTVGNVTGDGTLQLNLNASGTGISDSSGNAIIGGAVGPVYGIEHTLPVVTSITTVGSATNNAGSDQYTVTFSENVSGVNALDFALANTGSAGGVITSVTGSGNTYTVLVNPAFGDGTMRLDFHPNTPVIDAAGNLVGSSFTNGQSFVVEHTPPVVTSIVAAAGDSSSAGSEQFTVAFSENVGGVAAGDFTLATTGTVGGSIAAVTPINPVNGLASTYSVTVNGVTGIGTLQVNLNASGTGITDAAGNALLGGGVGQIYGITHTLPAVSSIVLDDPATNNLGSEQFTVNFSENVTGVNAADFSLTNSNSAGGVITSVTGSGSTYTVLVNPAFGDGTMRLDLNALTTIVDATGNTTAGGYTAGPSYTIEHTPPVATSIVTANSNPNNAGTETYTVTFSENVTGVDSGDFTLANTGTVSGAISAVTPINPLNGAASTYTVTIGNVMGAGTMQLNLNASGTGITDAAGNALVGGAVGEVYAIAHTLPVVTSIGTVGANPNNAATDQYTVTFSEAVTGVSAADFSLATTGTAAGLITSVTGSGNTYTVLAGPVTGTGTLGLNFTPVSPVADAYGNLVGSSFTGAVYSVDHTPPIATGISAAAGDSSTATSDQFVVSFSENVSGVDAADFSLITGGAATGTITAVTPVNPVNGSASSYTVAVDGVHGNGTLQVDLNSGTNITDVAGNVIVGGATGPVYGVNVTAPSVTSIALVDPSTNNLTTEQFTVNFSAAVGGVTANDFALTDSSGVTAGAISVAAVNPDGNGRATAYTVTVADVGGNGSMRLDLSTAESGITDAGGNAVSGGYTGGPSYTIDHTTPTVTSIALVGAATNNAGSEQFTVNFSTAVSGLAVGDLVLTDSSGLTGSIASVTAINPDSTGHATSYTVTVNNVVGNGTMRLDLSGSQSGIADAAGNAVVGGFTGGAAYTVDQTAPTVASITLVDPATNHAGSEQFTVNFSENVGGVNAADFTLTDSGSVTGAITTVTAVNPDGAGRASSYLVTVGGVTGDGSMRLDLSAGTQGITDAAGNAVSGAYTGGPAYTIEHTPPIVTSISTVGPVLTDGTSQMFTVDFSEGVTGVSANDFSLATTGTATATSIAVTGTPGSSVYTVTVSGVSGNGTLGLNLAATGTGITDAAGNPIAGGFNTGAAFIIDNTRPSITSIALVDAATNNLSSEQFTVTFSESVSGVGVNDFVLTDSSGVAGTIASVVAVNPDIFGHASTYTVTVNAVSGDGTMRLDLSSSQSGITDYALNSASGGYTAGPSYTLQHTPPAVTSIDLVDAATNNLGTEQFTVNFSENVGGVGIGDFALSNGGNVGGTITAFTAINPDGNGRASAYTVTVSNVSGDGTMQLDLSSSQAGIADAAGNAVVAGYSSGPAYTIEHTAPVVSSIALVAASTNNLTTEQFTVNFSEAVNGVVSGDFVLDKGGSVAGSISAVTPVNPDPQGYASAYTVTVSGVGGDGTLRLDLNGSQAGIDDAAGNPVVGGYTAGPAYTLEHTAPVVSSIALVGPATNNDDTELFTVNFSELVGGVNVGDFALTSSGSVAGTITAVTPIDPDSSGRAGAYTVTVSNVTGNGTLRLDLNASPAAITDTAGNADIAGYTGGPAYTLANAAPSVTSIALVDAATNNLGTEQFTVNFSENVGGVAAADFVLTNGGTVNGSIGSVTAINPDAQGRAGAYTVTVTGVSGDGSMRLDLSGAQSGITDAVGNAVAGAYEQGATYTIEHTAPVVSSIDIVGSASNAATTEQFTVNFSESVSGVSADDFVLTNSGTANGTIVSLTALNPDANGRASSYTVEVGGVSGTGTMRLDMNASTGILDAAGNALTTAFSTGQTYRIGALLPAVESINVTGANPNNAATETFVVNFNENVTGVNIGDFALATTGTAAGSIAAVSGSGSVYTVTVSGVSGDGTLRLDLNASGTGIVDAANNAVNGGFTTGQVYTLQHTAPTVTAIAALGASPSDAGTEQYTVTFSEAVNGVTAGDFALTETGTAAGRITAVSGSGNTYTVTVGNVTGDGTMRLDLNANAGNIVDAAGNMASLGFSAGQVITLDHTPPVVTAITPLGVTPNAASTEQFTVTFSENVTGVSIADFALVATGTAAGQITSVTGSGNTYVVTVSNATGDGTLRLDAIASAGITDAAGNSAGVGFSAGQPITVEHSPPAVEAVSTPASGTYVAGDTVQFTVTFNEPVVVGTGGGDPRIAVTLGNGVIQYANYTSGSGSNMLVFQYVVAAGDQSPGGVTLGKSIDLNGGTVVNAAGSSGNLVLANVAPETGIVIGDVTPQQPLPASGNAPAGGAAQSAAGYDGGYIDDGLYQNDHGLTTAGYLPLAYANAADVPAIEPLSTDIGARILDQSIQQPLAVGTLVTPVNAVFSFSVPVSSFQFDPGATVAVTAGLADGRALPSWLSFDQSTGKFVGTAPAGWTEHLHIVLSARDQNGRDVMLPVEVEFGHAPANPAPPTGALMPRTHRNPAAINAGRDSLSAQFARHGRHARERQFAALVGSR